MTTINISLHSYAADTLYCRLTKSHRQCEQRHTKLLTNSSYVWYCVYKLQEQFTLNGSESDMPLKRILKSKPAAAKTCTHERQTQLYHIIPSIRLRHCALHTQIQLDASVYHDDALQGDCISL